MRVWFLFALVAASACGEAPERPHGCDLCDAPPADSPRACNLLSQAGCLPGEKCSWIVDATTPTYVGHIGCVPDGTGAIGAACMYGAAGATGYDSCQKGAVCSAYLEPGTAGVCNAICDDQGGAPMCGATQACVTDRKLFVTGDASPPAAGECLPSCDPLADNDFDGWGSAFSRTGSACGSADIGCYAVPSGGTAPATAFVCMRDRNHGTQLVHRTECTSSTHCTDTSNEIYVNSCSQGYLPLSRESTAVSTTVCIAMCAPLDCYAGNCGSNNTNRLGAAPHRCASSDALGAFGSGEECQYLWAWEVDGLGRWLPSPYSDAVGFCFDHSKYQYDSNLDGTPDTTLPACEDLPLHGSGSAFDAVSLGCVSSQTAGLGSGSAVTVYTPTAHAL